MGKKTKTSFKRGKSGNPKGRPKALPNLVREEIKVVALDRTMWRRYLAQCLHLSLDELKAKEKDLRLPWVERRIAKMLVNDFKTSSVGSFESLAAQLFGPLTQRVEIDRSDRYANMSDEELLAEKRKFAELNVIRLRQVEQEREMYAAQQAREVSQPDESTSPVTALARIADS